MMFMKFSKEKFINQMGSMANAIDKKWADKMDGRPIVFPENKTVTTVGGARFHGDELVQTYVHISWCEPVGEIESWYARLQKLMEW